MKFQRKQSGVTLHELMVGLSVTAILLSIAAPSYSEFVSKRRVAGATNLIAMYLEDVKMQSIKRNAFIAVSYKVSEDGSQWCLGATLGKDTSCDCAAVPSECLIDSTASTISQSTYEEFDRIKTTFTEGTMTFDPVRGILTDPANALNMQIKHTTEDFRVNVSVNATGTVRKCTPAAHELVGYPTCI